MELEMYLLPKFSMEAEYCAQYPISKTIFGVGLRTSQSSKRPKRLEYSIAAISGAFDRICWEYENAAMVTRSYAPSQGAMARGVFWPGFLQGSGPVRFNTSLGRVSELFSREWLSFSTLFVFPYHRNPRRTPGGPLDCDSLQFCCPFYR